MSIPKTAVQGDIDLMKQCLISRIRQVFSRWSQEQKSQDAMAGWRRDPLSHPDIRRMSERERADLQFDPNRVTPE